MPTRGKKIVAALGALVLGALLAYAVLRPASDLPVLYRAPAFSLTDQTGRPFDSRQLRGTVWVADFIYTNCRDICPVITGNMAELRDSLRARGAFPGRVRFVSFSVDPERDTPAALTTFASRYGGADPAGWAFLTGPLPDVQRLLLDGFHVGLMKIDTLGNADPHGTQVSHSNRLLLIDRSGRVRGSYSGVDPAALGRLRRDLRTLL